MINQNIVNRLKFEHVSRLEQLKIYVKSTVNAYLECLLFKFKSVGSDKFSFVKNHVVEQQFSRCFFRGSSFVSFCTQGYN